jgi:protein-disulfide isomerase
MITKHFARALIIGFAVAMAASPFAQTAGSGRTVGPIVAKVTVDQTMNRVEEDYATKGKIRLVHHDFPLPMHQYAKQAALLAAAADRIGKFEQVSEALFRKQDDWSVNGKVEEAVDSVLTPEEAKKVRELAKDPAVAAVVQRDIDLGTRLNINQTPTIIITKNLKSERIAGFVTYPILSRYLDQLLAQP